MLHGGKSAILTQSNRQEVPDQQWLTLNRGPADTKQAVELGMEKKGCIHILRTKQLKTNVVFLDLKCLLGLR